MKTDEIRTEIIKLAKEHLLSDDEKYSEDMTLDSFEADSLDYVEFLFEVDDKFDVDIDNDKLNDSSLTLKQLIDLITTQVSISLKENEAQES